MKNHTFSAHTSYIALLFAVLVALLSFMWSASHSLAASTISETHFDVANVFESYYPFYLDDEQNPGWAPDGGSDDFSFIDYHKVYASGSMHLEYEVFLEDGEGKRLANNAQVKVGDVIEVVATTPEPCRDWGWQYGLDTSGWQANYTYEDVPAAPLTNTGGGPTVINDNYNKTAIVEDFASIRREDMIQGRFHYRGPSNGEDYYLAMYVESPEITHTLSGTASFTQLSDTTYRVDSPGSVVVETQYAATDALEYYAIEEEEIDRIMAIYEEFGYQSDPQRQLAYDRLQDLKSKVVDGIAVERVMFDSGDTFTIEGVTLTNQVDVVAADSTNPPAPDVTVVGGQPIYPGDEVTLEISAPGSSEPVIYKIDWTNDLGLNEVVDGPGPGLDFVSGSTILTTTRQWYNDGEKNINVRTYNEKGYLSDWTPVTVTVNEKPPVSMSLQSQVNGGAWAAGDRTIDPGDNVAVRWDSQYADSCLGYNVNTSGATSSMPGGVSITAPNAGDSEVYRVECTDGNTVAQSEIQIAAPVQPQLYAYLQPSTRSEEFNYDTGSYDEYTVNFVLANDAPADEPSSIPYTVSLDLDANGTYDLTESGTFSGGIGPESQEARNIEFNDIPFGQLGIMVDIDYPGLDALQTVVAVPPPEPDSALSVTPIIVRTGTEALIEWDVGASYPMDCTLRGGSLLATFDPSVDGPTGSTTTPALHSAMQYELRCLETNTGTEFVEEFRVEVIGSPIEM